MAWVLALLLAVPQQQPTRRQLEEMLRQFEEAEEIEQALLLLAARLEGLGPDATGDIADRVVEDLKDGSASASAPALIESLAGRPEALGRLQAAFRDEALSPRARFEMAEALRRLGDTASWKDAVARLTADPEVPLADRLQGLALRRRAGDAGALEALRDEAAGFPLLAASEQEVLVEFLAGEGLLREWAEGPDVRLAALRVWGRTEDARLRGRIEEALERRGGVTEEPRVRVTDEIEVPPPGGPVRRAPKKVAEEDDSYGARSGAWAAVALGVLALVFWMIQRRGRP